MKWRLLEEAQADGGTGGGAPPAVDQPDPEIERRAKELGWTPKESFRGNPDNWLDAREYVKRGETFVPFLQAQRKRLQGDLEVTNTRLNSVQQELQQTRQQLQEITEFNRQMAVDRDARRKSELGASIRTEEDPVRRAEMETELRQVTDREAKRSQEPPRKEQAPLENQPPQIQPWVSSFLGSNQEFFLNPDKVALFNSRMAQRRQSGDRRVGEIEGTALLSEVRDEVDRMLGGNSRRQAPSRAEESRTAGGGSGSRSGGKGYHDMPADAQAKCDSLEAKFVGTAEGKFKTKEAWQKYYAAEYFT